MTLDRELLATFARTNSEDAFAELVRRHVSLVYSAALRQVGGDAHLAQDVAQTVFTDLARKAAALARRESLTGWLYTSAHFAAAKIVRTETRRRDREEKFMREPTNESSAGVSPDAALPNEWNQLSSTLDAAMHELKESDREAILLRYFENRAFAEVGTKLGLNENAARMRVERALEKLRGVFAKRGVAVTASLAAVISANAVPVAPVGLSVVLATTAITGAGVGTFTLLKIMTMTKLKLGMSALIVVGTATALVLQHQATEKLRGANEALTQQLAQLQTESESFSNRLAAAGESKKLPDEQFRELLKLRGEVGLLRNQVGEIKKLRAENAEVHQALTEAVQTLKSLPSPEQALFNKTRIKNINNSKEIELAMKLFANDHSGQFPTNLVQLVGDSKELPPKWTNIIDNFELVNVGMTDGQYPDAISIREKNPRQSTDGKWERVYGLADGSAWFQTSADGSFDAYEKQHQIPPQNQ